MSEYLRAAAQAAPDRVAIIEPSTDRRVTWRELDDWVDRVARAVLGLGLRAGQRVALVMDNGIDQTIAYFALLRGGMVAVPISPRSSPRGIGRIVADSQVRLVVGDARSIDHVRAADTGGARTIVHRAEAHGEEIRFGTLLEHGPTGDPIAPPDPESLAVILYTAGASGLPRGAMLSHRALIANIEQLAGLDTPPVAGHDVLLGLLPMSHIYGLNAILGQAVRAGAQVVMVDSFDPAAVLDLIGAHGVTNVPVAPPIIEAWVDLPNLADALAGVRIIVSGASPLDPEVVMAFAEASGHVVEQGYGLTETAPVITVTLAAERVDGDGPPPGSVGRPLPGVEVELRDGLGNVAVPGDPAQVWVRGDNLFSGYWPDGDGAPGDDGWWATGDMGFWDDAGNLVLVDRLREVLKVSGFAVYPSEIEEVIVEVAGVDQAAVVGRPAGESGDEIVAFVVPRDDVDPDVVREAVEAACAADLARFKQPAEIIVVEGLPHSPTGKIAKGRLRAMASGPATDEPNQPEGETS